MKQNNEANKTKTSTKPKYRMVKKMFGYEVGIRKTNVILS